MQLKLFGQAPTSVATQQADPPPRREQMISLLSRAARAHHQAFAERGGEDPKWASWDARYLQESVQRLSRRPLPVMKLTALLVRADVQHRFNAPQADWRQYYADYLLQRLR